MIGWDRVSIAALLWLAACGPGVDKAAMAAVDVTASGAAPSGCRALVSLEGKDTDRWVPGGPYYEKAVADLRRQAVVGGGNFLLIDSTSPPRDTDYMPAWVVHAQLFSCPRHDPNGPLMPPLTASASAPPPVASAPPPPAPICEPDCSPGYTCLRGKCVSACNPLCSAGERCGADRICHPAPTGGGPPARPAP